MSESEAQDGLRGGAAVVTITPPLGSLLAGLFRPRVSVAVASELTARALVLRQGDVTLALVTLDVVGLSAPTIASARRRIADQTGIPPECVMLSATHTHSGPYTTYRLGVEPDRDYLDWIGARAAEAVAVAVSRLEPVTVAVGSSTVDGVCFNRRYTMADGTVRTNPGAGNPDVVGPAGPIDPTVTSMLVERPDGTPVALWANLSLHYVGTDSDDVISADYYGDFAEIAARWLGDGAVAMLSNGAQGDINNVDLDKTVATKGSVRARQVAQTVAGAAISGPMMARRRSDVALGAIRIPFSLERYAVTDDDVALARQILDAPEGQAPEDLPFSFVTGSPLYPIAARYYAESVLDLQGRPRTSESELLIFRIGDLALVGLPGEMFVEFGLAIRERSPFAMTAVVGLCGELSGYMATTKAFAEGGYETWRSAISWTAHGTGEAMVEAVCAKLPALAEGV